VTSSEPDREVQTSYDAVAAEYAERLSAELDGKPLDRALLDEVAARANGTVCDLGCGPGHVANYLRRRGANVVGVDVSSRMVEEARRRHPELRFEVGDMRSLVYGDGAFAAVAAMYSLIHFDDADLAVALSEIRRVLAPDGVLLAAFHRGRETVHLDELFGCRVNLDFRFFEPEQIANALADARVDVERLIERDPYPGVEVETRRFYVVANAGS
jgi:ubiquinone/menaquinone biosynthesis C-methylase UbiE